MPWDFIGNEWAVELLKEHVARGEVRHAYLITGPQGVGRRTLALRLAQALNCQSPPSPGEPCLKCRSCLQIARGQHPDLSIVQAELQGGTLRVEQVRELQHSLSLAPYEARYRVALLLRFEEANDSSSNALLKTLEEPPEKVILALTAESAEVLLPTIVSRCLVLRLRPATIEQVEKGLLARGLPSEQASFLAHLSSGRAGFALDLHEHPEKLEQRAAWLSELRDMLLSTRVERFSLAEKLTKSKDNQPVDKEALHDRLQVWSSLWRDVFLLVSGSDTVIANTDQEELVTNIARQLTFEQAYCTLSSLERTARQVDGVVNSRMALEVLMLDLPWVNLPN